MEIIQDNSSYIRFKDYTQSDINILEDLLHYTDLSAKFQYNKARKNKRMYLLKGRVWEKHVQDLKNKIQCSALLNNSEGLYTYSGLLEEVLKVFKDCKYTNNVFYPEFHPMPWDLRYEPLKLYPYQDDAVKLLLSQKHCAIEISTAGGKTFVLERVVKAAGLRTLIVVPYAAIAHQFLDQFTEAFGKRYVGLYGDGKKNFKTQVTIGIAASLSKLKIGDPAYEVFSQKEILGFDESHLCSAPTVSRISLGLGKLIPYKYSVSATPFSGKGIDTFLTGIIGPVKFRKHFKELVSEGYLSPLHFKIVNVNSNSQYSGSDPLKTKQEHYLYNSELLQKAAAIIDFKRRRDESVLVIIDEKEQVNYLKRYLKSDYILATSDDNCAQVVKDFNNLKTKLVIGTTAITTGANFRPVQTLVFLSSGKSEIRTKQALGRGTRLFPNKTHCDIVDFNVQNIPQLQRHLNERLNIYNTLSDNIEFLDI